MTHGIATADALPMRRASFFTIALLVAVPIVGWQAGAAIADLCSATCDFALGDQSVVFDQRFPEDLANSPSLPLVRGLSAKFEADLQAAKTVLARKLIAESPPAPPIQETPPAQDPPTQDTPATEEKPQTTAAFIPLPKRKPAEAVVPAQSSDTAETDNRTLLQKLADLVRPRFTLASLTPSDALTGNRPNLASLGYDSQTAVYDISARTIYMPDGSKLEAHSGLGSLKDDPLHVDKRGVGATPPAVYSLKLREKSFHGVEALRMIPAEHNDTLGRSGLLVHSYMLGPDGDSNGCVSIRDYEKFLNAFRNGEVKQLIVVVRLPDSTQQTASKS
jgi:Tlde1 domain